MTKLRQRLLAGARAAAGILPDGMLARLLPGSLGWDSAAMRVAHPPQGNAVRLLVGPVNSAGQGYRWSRAAEDFLVDVGAVSVMTTNAASDRFDFPVDVRVPESAYVFARGWQRQQRAAILDECTHVLLESGRFAYGSIPGKSPLQIVEQLATLGPAVALLWHGTDIRLPSQHAVSELDSPFGPNGAYPAGSTEILEKNAIERMRMVTETELPVFVSTPGLLHVPRSLWLPVVVDVERWRTPEAPLQRKVPVVTYVPSNSPMKGDPSIDTQMRELEALGLISYRRLQGIPSHEMPEVYRSADIVLDQFRLGDYGVAACEALAAGRVVIGHVSAENRERVRRLTGLELPIVESRFPDIGTTIRHILEDRALWAQRAADGPTFTRAIHDGAASARALSGFLGAEIRES
ncbi:glycosyltransferase [Microbacterium sp. A93]|uniref:glycosyltransferase n=1 Tax=Microbacterium sp. A93 TaxID=3450716 RepID=UPI003F42E4A8